MRLDDNKTKLTDLIYKTGSFFNIDVEFVEKDYWVVLLLKKIFEQDRNYVFKGGTSLSKCYKIINRFSEDIDISYCDNFNDISVADRNKRFRNIIKSVESLGLCISNKTDLRRGAYFNRFVCPYKSMTEGNNIDKMVYIELAAQTPSFPVQKMKIQSFIGEYLENNGNQDLVVEYGLEPFEINVQALKRTVVDKTFAICDYYLESKPTKHSRHLYDIYKSLPIISLNSSLKNLFLDVRNYRKKIKVCRSAQEGIKLHEVLSEVIEKDFYKDDYNKTTLFLLYESIPYSKCKEALIRLCDFLKQINI